MATEHVSRPAARQRHQLPLPARRRHGRRGAFRRPGRPFAGPALRRPRGRGLQTRLGHLGAGRCRARSGGEPAVTAGVGRHGAWPRPRGDRHPRLAERQGAAPVGPFAERVTAGAVAHAPAGGGGTAPAARRHCAPSRRRDHRAGRAAGRPAFAGRRRDHRQALCQPGGRVAPPRRCATRWPGPGTCTSRRTATARAAMWCWRSTTGRPGAMRGCASCCRSSATCKGACTTRPCG